MVYMYTLILVLNLSELVQRVKLILIYLLQITSWSSPCWRKLFKIFYGKSDYEKNLSQENSHPLFKIKLVHKLGASWYSLKHSVPVWIAVKRTDPKRDFTIQVFFRELHSWKEGQRSNTEQGTIILQSGVVPSGTLQHWFATRYL